jgi:hypothetical protein
VGSKGAGRAEIPITALDKDGRPVVVPGVVCAPRQPYRPKCVALVRDHGHMKACRPCYLHYPPGTENRYNRAGHRGVKRGADS